MKKITILHVLFLCLYFTINAQNSSQVFGMSEEEAILFFLKINNVDPDEITYHKGVIDNKYNKQPDTWTKSYLERLDSYNYKMSKNDEFKCYELFKKTRESLISKSQKLNFDKKFSIILQTKLGEYDFNNESFPINLSLNDNPTLFPNPKIYLCDIENIKDFKYSGQNHLSLKLSPTEASKFINSRKNINTGYVDRSVYLKITYSIINNVNYSCSKYFMVDFYTGLTAKAYSIEVWTDQYAADKKLGLISKQTETFESPNSQLNNTNTVVSIQNCGTVSDIDGNVYNTVKIGNQCWFRENLKTSKYNDGTDIYNSSNQTEWSKLSQGAYCYLNDNPTYNQVYGKLYNWYAVDTKKLCPLGWHVPSDKEWKELTTFLGGEDKAGHKMKSPTLWETPYGVSSNSSGFSAIPAGSRGSDGTFATYKPTGQYTNFWSSNSYGYNNYASKRNLNYQVSGFYSDAKDKRSGFCVRCLKDYENDVNYNNNNSDELNNPNKIDTYDQIEKRIFTVNKLPNQETSFIELNKIKSSNSNFDITEIQNIITNTFDNSTRIEKNTSNNPINKYDYELTINNLDYNFEQGKKLFSNEPYSGYACSLSIYYKITNKKDNGLLNEETLIIPGGNPKANTSKEKAYSDCIKNLKFTINNIIWYYNPLLCEFKNVSSSNKKGFPKSILLSNSQYLTSDMNIYFALIELNDIYYEKGELKYKKIIATGEFDKIDGENIICKIKSGEENLKEYIDSGKKFIAISSIKKLDKVD